MLHLYCIYNLDEYRLFKSIDLYFFLFWLTALLLIALIRSSGVCEHNYENCDYIVLFLLLKYKSLSCLFCFISISLT